MDGQAGSYIGASLPPRDHGRLLRGQGRYCDDVPLVDPLHVVFLRSDLARGSILSIGTEAARTMPGVWAVHLGADVAGVGAPSVNEVMPLRQRPAFPLLARDEVQSVGQPLAAVLANSRAAAADAVEAIEVDIAEDGTTEDADPLIAERRWQSGEAARAMASAPRVVSCTVSHVRLAPMSLEPRAICVDYDRATDRMTVWHSSQTPHRTRTELCAALGLEADRLRVIAPDVGGAFGLKASLYPEEVFVVWAAMTHRRSVKWIATRSEDFLSGTHGRGIDSTGRLALDGEGRFLALEARISAPLGRWLPNSALIPVWNAARVLPGPYDVASLDIVAQARAENRAATGIYRGAGRPEAATLMERLVDKAGRAAGLDPFEIRRRNLLPEEALPHETGTGETLDSGNYAGALERLREMSGYDARKTRVVGRRAQGELVGLGVSFYLEPSGKGWESARVTWRSDGTVLIASGSSAQGQARRISFAQIAADALDVTPARIEVLHGDTQSCPAGIGALASRSTAIGGSAVLRACAALRRRRDAGEALPLIEETIYENDGQAWGYGCYLVQVAIDPETGTTRIEDAFCVDDTGIVVNPRAVEDQIVGGFAQGLGQAMMEALHYDDDGQLQTASLMDYAIPRAADMPPLTLDRIETPSPMNALGAKGVGEAGTIGAPVALLNAAVDALSPLGITDLQMPLSPPNVWQAIQDATQRKG